MKMGLLRWLCCGLAVSMAYGFWSHRAEASHYRLAVLEAFDESELEALHEAGVETTEDFLTNTLDGDSRHQLSERTGVGEAEILAFAKLCEMIQIEGVGPRAAQLLFAAGVVNVADLAARDPVELTERVVAANAVEQLTGIDPSVENLIDWIEAAGQVPYHIE